MKIKFHIFNTQEVLYKYTRRNRGVEPKTQETRFDGVNLKL